MAKEKSLYDESSDADESEVCCGRALTKPVKSKILKIDFFFF